MSRRGNETYISIPGANESFFDPYDYQLLKVGEEYSWNKDVGHWVKVGVEKNNDEETVLKWETGCSK